MPIEERLIDRHRVDEHVEFAHRAFTLYSFQVFLVTSTSERSQPLIDPAFEEVSLVILEIDTAMVVYQPPKSLEHICLDSTHRAYGRWVKMRRRRSAARYGRRLRESGGVRPFRLPKGPRRGQG